MEIKDLACAVELAEVRGGTRGRSALLDFDFDVTRIGNQDAYQVGANSAYMSFGNIQANTAVWARGGVDSPISGVGSVNTYAPGVALSQSNTNNAANYPQMAGVTF
jgi:hypothetical protein